MLMVGNIHSLYLPQVAARTQIESRIENCFENELDYPKQRRREC